MITLKTSVEIIAQRLLSNLMDVAQEAVDTQTPAQIRSSFDEAEGALLALARHDKEEIRKLFINGRTPLLISQPEMAVIEKNQADIDDGNGGEEVEIRIYTNPIGAHGQKLLLVIIDEEINY